MSENGYWCWLGRGLVAIFKALGGITFPTVEMIVGGIGISFGLTMIFLLAISPTPDTLLFRVAIALCGIGTVLMFFLFTHGVYRRECKIDKEGGK